MSGQDDTGVSVIPYARPYWDEDEASAILEALNSGMWTNGDQVIRFERELTRITGVPAVTMSSGSSAILALLHVLGELVQGPKLLVTPALTFAAGPAAARLLGWDVGLCDVASDDLTTDPASVAELLDRVRHRYSRIVVLPVHYAGHTADMVELSRICAEAYADLVEDACHAVGGRYRDSDVPVGAWPDSLAAYFSFHPTKPIASGEGGAVVTASPDLAARLRMVRNHNMVPVATHEHDEAPWPYSIEEPGTNFRLSDLHAAIGAVQAVRVEESRMERARIAARYHEALAELPAVRAVPRHLRAGSAHHLFPVIFDLADIGTSKRELLDYMHGSGIRCQVHYTPLHRLRAFADVGGDLRSSLQNVDMAFPGLVSLPLWRGMTDADQERVLDVVTEIVHGKGRGKVRDER